MPESQIGSDEKSWVEELKKGNKEALAPLVEFYKKRAYSIALGFVHNQEDALEMSQLAFIKVYRSIRHFDSQRAFFPWFYQILRNTCFNFLQKKKNLKEEVLEEGSGPADPSIFTITQNPEEDFQAAERKKLLAQAIEQLKPKEKEILLMQHFHQMSYSEIAESLGIPIGTVMSRLYQARCSLRTYLEKHYRIGSAHEL